MATATTKRTVAIYASPDNVALASLPADLSDNFNFAIGTDLETLRSQGAEDAEALLVIFPYSKMETLSSEIYPALKNLKWVHSFSAGVDAYAPLIRDHLMKDSHVSLTCGRSAFSSSLAEYIMMAALHFNKQVPRCLENTKSGSWDRFSMAVLANKTIGFVGYGDIAQQAAKAAKFGFGMEVRALRRTPFPADQIGNGALVDVAYDTSQLTQLFSECDFVVSTLPGTSATHNMIGKEQIGAMKSTGVFISCGRGTVVDEDAVAIALKEERIAGAAMDVFQIEPLPKESALWECPNILITAHNADLTDDFFELGWKVWRQNLECFLAGKPMATPVDKENGY